MRDAVSQGVKKKEELLSRIELPTFPPMQDAVSQGVKKKEELLSRIELPTSSLPRKCSTAELQQLLLSLKKAELQQLEERTFKKASGRRDSNPRPTAWKAVALPTELLPLISMCEYAN